MKKVFVSGGSGCIAMYCIKILLEKGYDVVTSVRKESQIDLIKKSLHIFDKLIVATTDNNNKDYFFSIEERLDIINNSLFYENLFIFF